MKEEVIYKKVINECRECPNCRIIPDFYPYCFNDKNDKAICSINKRVIVYGLQNYAKIAIPDWYPLKNE